MARHVFLNWSDWNGDFCLNPAIAAFKNANLISKAGIVRRSVIKIGGAAARFAAYRLYEFLILVKESRRLNPASTEELGTSPVILL
jgi:hypothetical protein